jgi:LacI family transcriptional regulator
MTTMHDVAKLAGVSAKTVSRVFNEDPHVAAATRQRVQWAMEKLDYVPNMLARSFRAGADPALGIAVPNIADPFFAAMARSIEDEAFQRSMAVVVTSLTADADRERPSLEALLRRQLSGLIVAPVAHDQSYLAPWLNRTPIVFVDRAPAKLAGIHVVEDDYRGAHDAVTHLMSHGHRRIAFIGDSLQIPTTKRRLDGYKGALRAAKTELDPNFIRLIDTAETLGARAAMTLLDEPTPPTAFFSSNPRCTMSLVLALQAVHRTDVALVGFGDFPMAEALTPAVTVIDQNPGGLGRNAVGKLFERLENPDAVIARKTVLPVTLLPRGSGELRPRPASARGSA